jgi:hypothetical protein
MLSATSAARGVSIMVPTGNPALAPRSANTVGGLRTDHGGLWVELAHVPTSGIMISALTGDRPRPASFSAASKMARPASR